MIKNKEHKELNDNDLKVQNSFNNLKTTNKKLSKFKKIKNPQWITKETKLCLSKEKIKEIKRNNCKKRKKSANLINTNNDGYIIELEGISKYYINGRNHNLVLDQIDLKIKKGEFVVLFGKSGSGKSTLLNLISGLDRPSLGNLIVANTNLAYCSNEQLLKFRRKNVSFIFQAYNLLTNLNGLDNVKTGSYLQKDETKKIDIDKLFQEFDLEDIKFKFPAQMSGGQQQRISILRALAKNSDIIFADEPTGALDEETSKIVLDLLQKINKENNKTIIMVSHNPSVAKYSTRVIKIKNKKIVADYYNN